MTKPYKPPYWPLLIPATILLVLVSRLGAEDKKPEAPQLPNTVSLTVGQVLHLGEEGALGKLAQQDFPVATAFRIRRMIDIIRPEMDRAIKARAGIWTDKNSTLQADGSRIAKPESLAALNAEWGKLSVESITLQIAPIDLEGDLPGVKLSALDIEALGPLLKQPPQIVPAKEPAKSEQAK